MTIPTRPAPLPPNSGLRNSSNTGIASTMLANTRKEAPPRPPPPKIKPDVAHKPVGILSNLFGSRNGHKSSDRSKQPSENRLPIKIPPPPSASASKPFAHCVSQKNFGAFNIDSPRSDMQLISFDDSPPPPQPTIKKSNTGSDCVSIGSFSSTTSSPHNFGATSQAERWEDNFFQWHQFKIYLFSLCSGFEDDFNVSDFKLTSNTTSRSTTFSSDPFECLDDFEAPKESTLPASLPNIRNVKPPIQPKPTFESSSFYLSSASSTKVVAENLEAGKNLMKPSTNSMPTIIKPAIANKSKALLSEARRSPSVDNARRSDEISDDSFSLPMPTIPPPQLPSMEPDLQEEEGPSYAVVLYDFESDVVEDLNLRVSCWANTWSRL